VYKGTVFVKKTKSSSYTFGAGQLPAGNTMLRVRAVDPEGADVWASTEVYIAPEAADFDADEKIFSMDVQQAVGSNDPSMVTSLGSSLSILKDISSKNSGGNKGGNQGRRKLLADGSSSTDSIDDVVKIKVMELMAALSSSAAANNLDAATVRQVGAAVDVSAQHTLSTKGNARKQQRVCCFSSHVYPTPGCYTMPEALQISTVASHASSACHM
jgi:hypothetical protein